VGAVGCDACFYPMQNEYGRLGKSANLPMLIGAAYEEVVKIHSVERIAKAPNTDATGEA